MSVVHSRVNAATHLAHSILGILLWMGTDETESQKLCFLWKQGNAVFQIMSGPLRLWLDGT
jgi:hypothetical protein